MLNFDKKLPQSNYKTTPSLQKFHEKGIKIEADDIHLNNHPTPLDSLMNRENLNQKIRNKMNPSNNPEAYYDPIYKLPPPSPIPYLIQDNNSYRDNYHNQPKNNLIPIRSSSVDP